MSTRDLYSQIIKDFDDTLKEVFPDFNSLDLRQRDGFSGKLKEMIIKPDKYNPFRVIRSTFWLVWKNCGAIDLYGLNQLEDYINDIEGEKVERLIILWLLRIYFYCSRRNIIIGTYSTNRGLKEEAEQHLLNSLYYKILKRLSHSCSPLIKNIGESWQVVITFDADALLQKYKKMKKDESKKEKEE